jgi:YHS domain-containing protein
MDMIRTYIASAVAGALILATAAFAATGQFNNMCSWGLANSKQVHTNCSVNAQINGQTYCFSNKDAKAQFMKNPSANLKKAETYYSKIKG